MLALRFAVWIFSVGLMVLNAAVVCGQNYPNKSIRIVTDLPGSGSDFTSRLVVQGISGALGQPVIVDNRGTWIIAAETVAKSPPDGYSLLIVGGALWLLPLMQDNVPYDVARDFSPITLTDRSLNVLVVPPSVAANSVKELISLAKARPGELNYATGPAGSANHLAGELFKAMADVNIVRVPYKGSGPALNGLIGGEVQLMFATAPAAMPLVKSAKLRALAITSAEPSALVPGVPTIAASLPGYESVSRTGIFAPAKTPAAIINRLNQEIVRFLKTTEAKDRFFNSGVESVGNSPEELAATMKSDIAKWGKVIKDAGIKAE